MNPISTSIKANAIAIPCGCRFQLSCLINFRLAIPSQCELYSHGRRSTIQQRKCLRICSRLMHIDIYMSEREVCQDNFLNIFDLFLGIRDTFVNTCLDFAILHGGTERRKQTRLSRGEGPDPAWPHDSGDSRKSTATCGMAGNGWGGFSAVPQL